RGGDDPTSTMLTLSERWFTIHTSLAVRTATATGSRPTVTEVVETSAGLPSRTSRSSRRASGVFTAKRRGPSAGRASRRPRADATRGSVVDVGVVVTTVVVLPEDTSVVVVLVDGGVVVLGGAAVVEVGDQRQPASQASPSTVFPSSHSSLPVRSPLPHTDTVQ